jgi:Family of unknown function (DUF5955)
MTEHNDGIMISGGSVNVTGSMVAGRRAQVHTVINQAPVADSPEVQQTLLALEASLRDHAQELADHAAAVAQLEALTDELRQPQPRRSRVTELLITLRDNVGSVAAVAANVASVQHLLAGLL